MTSALEAAGNEAVGEVLKAIAAIDSATTQSEILQALIDGALRFASRAAFFLTRPEKIRGWAGGGFGRAGAALEGLELDYEGPWSAIAAGTGAIALSGDECTALTSRVDADQAVEGLLIPFVLRGQLGGALYADRLVDRHALGVSSLLLLTHTASQALETAVFRTTPSPSLRLREPSEAGASGLRFWQEAPQEPPGEAPPTSADAREPETVAESPREAPAGEAPAPEPPEAAVPEPALEAPPAESHDAMEAPAQEPDSAEAAEPAVDLGFETTAEPEPLEEEFAEEPEPELEDTSTDIWALEEDEEDQTAVSERPPETASPTPPPAESPPTAIPAVGQETVRLDVAELQDQDAPAPPPVTADQGFEPPEAKQTPPEIEYELEPVEEPPPEKAESEPPRTEEAAPAGPEAEAADLDDSEEPTIITRQPLADAAAPPPQVEDPASQAGYVPPPPAEPAGASTQVQPPADLQGPGSAFSQTAGHPQEMSANEEALHEEARRLARLLVSEIKLYNEEIIEEGRRNGDIYERLKEDIDRSRQMYEERIDPRLHGKEDYFRQELVQRLAGGDEGLLGM